MPRKVNDDSTSVTWLQSMKGEKIENDDGVDCYSQCIVNKYVLSVGDFVYVTDPDQPIHLNTQRSIGKIKVLYENVDPLFLDYKYRMIVDSYRRPSALPEELIEEVPDLDFKREVVRDPVKFAVSLPLSSVSGKCNVMHSDPSKSIPETLANLTDVRNKQHLYICRYKIANRNGILSLIAIDDCERRVTSPKRKVSPIKIVNKNSVQKVSKLSQHEAENMFSESDSELDESPAKVLKTLDGHNSSFEARRNLNSSLNDAAGNSVMMGSIVASPHRKKNDLKMTIKVTRKENLTNASDKSNSSNTPLKAIQYNNNELDNLSKRQSATKRRIRARSPMPLSPTKTPKRSGNHQCGTPYQENRLIAPRRSISFASKKTPDIAAPSEQENLNESPSSSTKMSLRRSTRRSSVHQISLTESPLDIYFMNLEDSSKTLDTSEKQARKTPSKTLKKSASKTTKQSPRKTPRKTANRTIGRSLDLSIDDYYEPPKSLDGTLDDSLESPQKSARKTPIKTPRKASSKTPKRTPSTRVSALQPVIGDRKTPFVEINGMRLTEPRQAYVQIYQQLTGDKVILLEKRFKTPNIHRKTTVLLVDELDILCNRRQDVIYNLLDWPTKTGSQLIVVTIANTMDLPERLLMGRVTSRLGLTRLSFQPYTHKQLQEVVLARLKGTNIFENDAFQLVARKVASISGDCRRALDICRRATEIAEADCNGKKVMVSMLHFQKAFNEMITNLKVIAIKGCSKYEKFFLQAVETEVLRTGVDETVFHQVYKQFESICVLNGASVPEPGIALRISSRLGSSRILICEHSNASIHQKIMLNVTSDDIHYALHVKNDE